MARSSRPPLAQARNDSVPDTPFAAAVIEWQRVHGRHSLPWQFDRTPYRVWLSEIMLQQTQVATVIPYYEKFLSRYGDVISLANAEQAEVMSLWAGLGYYSRARNLHLCAQHVRDRFQGRFPSTLAELISLPGIGRSTAAAIAVFACGRREAILDGNVKRVFCRYFGVSGELQKTGTINQLWQIAETQLARSQPIAYTQGLMDLGATCCTRSKPACEQCPLAHDCDALATDRVAQLPTRKKKKALPERQTIMLMVRKSTGRQVQILVERRPQIGIWPGLLSLFESALDVAEPVSAHLQSAGLLVHGVNDADRVLSDADHRRLETIAHTFSHYRLQIHPVLIDFDRRLTIPSRTEWLSAAQLDDAALPAPIKKLLQSVLAEN